MLVFMFVSTSSAQDEIPSDIYDENTEITIRGEIVEIYNPPKSPVVIKVKTENRLYNVLTAPAWFLMRNNLTFKPGERVEITGSKFITRNGDLYIITRICKHRSSANPCIFRDEFMRPMWRGGMHRR